MDKFFIPAQKPEDWKAFLADAKHWKTGYSAKSLAHCWQEANDFPKSIRDVFEESGIDVFKSVELLIAFPEFKVPLVGGLRPSQNDIFILAKGTGQLISITVEGKVSEDFGQTIAKWRLLKNEKTNKEERLKYLLQQLGLEEIPENIRYQLIHRVASAIIEAGRFSAKNALMLVHSFSPAYEHFDDYNQFLALFGLSGKKDALVGPKIIHGINLYFGWVKEEKINK